ncbi:hypothetical protein [Frondihabitans cladoniiphilus]|uniref:Uncharacterized protein n=1 Tax=Frondihabitans cladoniiphilus TaxID=715785 RepID=A0ABP8W9I4_9MICO
MTVDPIFAALASTRLQILMDLDNTAPVSRLRSADLRVRVLAVVAGLEDGSTMPIAAWQQLSAIQQDLAGLIFASSVALNLAVGK